MRLIDWFESHKLWTKRTNDANNTLLLHLTDWDRESKTNAVFFFFENFN